MLPEDEYEITIVGLSAEQAKNLPKGIRGIQRTQNVQELAQLYSEADVLINPTYEDNFPTVNIEALACGTPVITYRTGGSPEAVRDEVSGGFMGFWWNRTIQYQHGDRTRKRSGPRQCRHADEGQTTFISRLS